MGNLQKFLKYIAGIGILFLTSCQPKNLVFKEFNNLALDQLSFAGAAIKLNVVCYNPNSFGLQLNRTDFDIYIDSTYFGHSSQDMQIAVPRKRDFTVPIKVNLDIKNLLKNGITSYFNKNVKVKVLGSVMIGKGGVYKSFPVNYTSIQNFSFR